MDTQSQLEAHEKECAMFRELVNAKLTGLDKRMYRLEAVIFAIAVGVLSQVLGLV